MRGFLPAWALALRVVGLTFRAQLEYRGEFWMRVALGLAWQTSIIVFATVLLGRFPGMGGWSSDAVLMIAAVRMLGHAFYEVFFGRVGELAVLVQEGRFDAFLLRPLPVYRQVQLSAFPSNALGDLLVGGSLFAWAVWSIELEWAPWQIAYIVAALVGGMLVEAAVFTALSSLHLHFPSAITWSYWTEELMTTFGNYPLKILPGVISGAFTFVVPLAFVAYFPVAVLTGNTAGLGVPVAVAAAAPLIGLAAFAGSRVLWNWSLTRYTGVNG
ncbi:ABC transporter permease [Nonomuraea endophytica]|uniref:ABC-2 type transport system permease protein n=1 Tax=Nonomuraea endophytica TaxID=714136 RepID=A0A7W8A4A0_9ACTN|nr:ABC-2 family transporter protein [Nonomuraea endophytica]MBB5078739.1 ABC-2 type transport system permease protein [Nonomuraea endophytica]